MRIRSWWSVLLTVALLTVGLLAIPTPSSAADSEIRVRARGRLGTERIELLVNGSEVTSWELDAPWFETFVYKVPAGTTVGAVRVRNSGEGWPSAVVVDWVEVNGQQLDSSDWRTLSSGSWDAATGCDRGYKQSDWLTCDNSWFDYELIDKHGLISVTARGRLGTENVDLLLDGDQVASWELDTSFETFYYRLPDGQDPGQVRVRNNSGGWPNAVVVDHVTVDGTTYDSSSWRTLSSGSWDSAAGCGQGVKMSDWLTCNNSWFDYGVDQNVPKYRVIRVNARGRLGTETLDLIVNGRTVESWQLGTDTQAYYHLYSPDSPISSVRVESPAGWPSAAIVDFLFIEGFTIDSSDGRTRSYGAWTPTTGCAEGIKRSDWLTCGNSWFEYDLRSARDPVN